MRCDARALRGDDVSFFMCVYCECGVVWCDSGAVGFDVCEALAYRDCAVCGVMVMSAGNEVL